MTIEFLGKQFDKYERLKTKPYIGYFTPEGKLVDYNTFLGGSHGQLGNIVSWTFLLWIKQSNAFKSLGIQDFRINAKLNLGNGIIKNADIATGNISSNLAQLQKDLIQFLKKAEANQDFIDCIKKRIDSSKIPTYVKRNKKIPMYCGPGGAEGIYEIENVFGKYNTKELLLFLKDICVQYLGYDSIEQFMPSGEFLKIPLYYLYYPEDYYTYFDKPRVITTTSKNINERFYNYLLMEWRVQQLPKYIFNEVTQSYEINTNSFQSEKDEIYEKEIQSIKKLVPLRERTKYFR